MQILNNDEDRLRLGTEQAVLMTAWERMSEPRLARSSIFNDISQAISKARQWLVTQMAVRASTCARPLADCKCMLFWQPSEAPAGRPQATTRDSRRMICHAGDPADMAHGQAAAGQE